MPEARVPKGWTRATLADVGDWRSGGTPSKSRDDYWNGSVPWVSPKDIKVFSLGDTQDHISERAILDGARSAPRGTVFVVVRGMILAHTFPVCVAERHMAFNQDVKAIVPSGGVHGRFIAHWMVGRSDALLRLVTEATHGTKRIDLGDLLAHSIPLPPPHEQKRIAEILDTIDEAIRKTEAIVAKLEQVKQGLLYDLLTRGIDDNGELRDPDRHPEQFKDSPLGRIPRAWHTTELGNLLSGIDAGWSPACIEQTPQDGEWGVLKVSAVTSGRFVASESKTLPPGLQGRPELEVHRGDVVVARANGVSDLVGVSVQVTECPPRLMLSDKLMRLNCAADLHRSYLAMALKSEPVRRQIARSINGSSGQQNISQVQLRHLIVTTPNIDEQRRIAETFGLVVVRHERESAGLEKLRLLKQGLMEDLLTGRVRVTPLLANEASTTEAP